MTFYNPCTRCGHKDVCERRALLRSAISGQFVTTVKIKCDIPTSDFPQGTRVHTFSARGPKGTVANWVNGRAIVIADKAPVEIGDFDQEYTLSRVRRVSHKDLYATNDAKLPQCKCGFTVVIDGECLLVADRYGNERTCWMPIPEEGE